MLLNERPVDEHMQLFNTFCITVHEFYLLNYAILAYRLALECEKYIQILSKLLAFTFMNTLVGQAH
jgi:hypothetical protein